MRIDRHIVLLCIASCGWACLTGCGTGPAGSSDSAPPPQADALAQPGANDVDALPADSARGVDNESQDADAAVAVVPLQPANQDQVPADGVEAAEEDEIEALDVVIPTSLQIGDAAPQFYVDKWMTGTPAEGFEAGKVHVVEFWATWCPPCRASMPHLSQLQNEYGDQVKFIGVTREDEATVAGFLEKPANAQEATPWREVVTYALALDKQDITNRSYMAAAKQRGIPTAFIVGRDGHIEWIGHPMQMDEPLESVVAGTWDRLAALAEMQRQQEVEAAMMEANAKLREAMSAEQWDDALAVIDGLLEKFPDQEQLRTLKFQVLLSAERASEAHALAAEIAETHWDDAPFLNQLAWMMATQIPEAMRDLDAALKLALRAAEVAGDNDASVSDTVARIYYEMSDLDQAIAWQQKAVDASSEAELQATLQKYLDEKSGAEDAEDAEAPLEEVEEPAETETDAGDEPPAESSEAPVPDGASR